MYTIGIEGEGFTAAPLEQLSSATGGQYYGASSTAALKSVYGTIGEVLKRTWRVQYVTAARPGDRIRQEWSSGPVSAFLDLVRTAGEESAWEGDLTVRRRNGTEIGPPKTIRIRIDCGC